MPSSEFRIVHPTKEDVIAGYERLIKILDKQADEYRERIMELKGQKTLTSVERR